MTTNIPAQPEAPDYAEANREGIYTDIETLPIRKQIEAAARSGSKITYSDPRTGEIKTADFTGQANWDDYAKTSGAAAWLAESDWKSRGYASRDDALQDYYTNIGSKQGDVLQRVNTGSDAELQKIATDSALSANAAIQKQQLDLRKELGVANAEQTRKELEATDPEGFAARESLVKKLSDDVNSAPSSIASNQSLGAIADRVRALTGSAPSVDKAAYAKLQEQIDKADTGRLGSLYDQVNERLNGNTVASTQAKNQLLQTAMADAERGGKLDDASRDEVIQATRAAQSSRGNFLGNSAAVAESMEVGQAAEDRRVAALGRLTTAQAQAYQQEQAMLGQLTDIDNNQYGRNTNAVSLGANLQNQQFQQEQSAYANRLQGMQTEANLTQAQTTEDRATRQENYGRDQQKLANISSMILGQPISNQFGNLGAAQQGAVGFQQVGYQAGTGLNANAGNQAAGFAQNNYGTAANMWNTTANIKAQDTAGLNSMISSGAGMALGMMV